MRKYNKSRALAQLTLLSLIMEISIMTSFDPVFLLFGPTPPVHFFLYSQAI